MVKRLKCLGIAVAVVLGLLGCRLAYIQLLGHEDLSAAAGMQQQIVLEGVDTRGIIYDRNGTPIAGDNQEYIFIIEKDFCDGETLNALQELEAQEVANSGSIYRVFTSQKYNKNTGERLIQNSGAYIMEAARRYRPEHPAVHMIGYVNKKDGTGASGLELLYDTELSGYNKIVSATADVQGHLLQGYGLRVLNSAEHDPYVKNGIVTTLDLGVQLEVERILREVENDGAVVIAECKTGDILAAASTPDFDPSDVQLYIERGSNELVNKVTQGEYPPGSVFKIVVAAAAIEAGMSPDKTFICNGSENINGHIIQCETGGEQGHGKITMREAFADSCNCAFIQMASKTGYGPISEMAYAMGLGSPVMDDFPGEKTGNITTVQQAKGAGIGNFAIGQGEILVTPLQIAQMTGIIANGGVLKKLNILKGSVDEEGTKVISKETAEVIQEMMALTVEKGTGSGMDTCVKSAVKTGSAESVMNGNKVIHGWITGYVPADDPEYIITVFIENGRSGRGSAAPVFSAIADYLHESGMFEYEASI